MGEHVGIPLDSWLYIYMFAGLEVTNATIAKLICLKVVLSLFFCGVHSRSNHQGGCLLMDLG